MDTQRLVEEFPSYLEANRLAKPRHIPFLCRWAERHLAAPYDHSLGPEDRLRAFLAGLERRPGVVDWQVCQAGDSVRLLRQFARAKPTEVGTPTEAAPLLVYRL